MIIIGLALSLFAVGFLCWLLFTLAVYATPFFVGVTAAFAAFNHGAGVIGALVVGIIASVVTLVASQAAFAVVKSPGGSRRDRPPLCGTRGRRGVSRDTRTRALRRFLRNLARSFRGHWRRYRRLHGFRSFGAHDGPYLA